MLEWGCCEEWLQCREVEEHNKVDLRDNEVEDQLKFPRRPIGSALGGVLTLGQILGVDFT